MRITPEYFDKLFELAKENIAKQTINMRYASTPKLTLAAETFHVHSFVVLFYEFFSYVAILKFD